MSESISSFAAFFNQAVQEAKIFLVATRNSELQRAACASLGDLLLQIATEKEEAIARLDEDYANFLLGCECVAHSLIAETTMWLLLKEDKPDEAWDQLVTAQSASLEAVRAHAAFEHLARNKRRLEAIEQMVFPPQVFISSGMVVTSKECSICGQEYEVCDHLLGKPYMGSFCYTIARDLEIDHVAIVEHPADKCCRVLGFKVEGGTRNRMTWLIEPDSKSSE